MLYPVMMQYMGFGDRCLEHPGVVFLIIMGHFGWKILEKSWENHGNWFWKPGGNPKLNSKKILQRLATMPIEPLGLN